VAEASVAMMKESALTTLKKNGNRTISTLAKLGLALLAIALLGGCQVVASPVAGLWMQNIGAPIDAGAKVGDREGKACATSYLGVFAMGDASIKAAAAAGGITKIESVDAEVTNMIVIGTFCTVVRGS
jgi:hypothetical protein